MYLVKLVCYLTWPHHRLTALLYLYMCACKCQLFTDEGSRRLPKCLNYCFSVLASATNQLIYIYIPSHSGLYLRVHACDGQLAQVHSFVTVNWHRLQSYGCQWTQSTVLKLSADTDYSLVTVTADKGCSLITVSWQKGCLLFSSSSHLQWKEEDS